MRPILFKGKSISGWKLGFYKGDHAFTDESYIGFTDEETYSVDGKTVCQFTGLKDCNGLQIFENDIVKVFGQFEVASVDVKDFEIITYQHVGTVFYENGSFVFKNYVPREKLIELKKIFEDVTLDTDITSYLDSFSRVEVLGNIFDNPELLAEAS